MATNRYEKYSIERMRENPGDPMEEELADTEAKQVADKILNHIGNSPNFRRRILKKMTERELNNAKREVSRLQDSLDNEPR